VCSNNLVTPMASADNEVLMTMESDLLRARAIEAIIERIVRHYATPHETAENQRAAVLQSIAKAETEQQRLVNALPAGGSGVSALVAALQKGQDRLDAMTVELCALANRRTNCVDANALRQATPERLVDWRGLLRGNTAEARRIVSKLLKGRLVFTPPMPASWSQIACWLHQIDDLRQAAWVVAGQSPKPYSSAE
jgi:hypothetical protein